MLGTITKLKGLAAEAGGMGKLAALVEAFVSSYTEAACVNSDHRHSAWRCSAVVQLADCTAPFPRRVELQLTATMALHPIWGPSQCN